MPKGAFYVFPNITKTGWKSKPLADALLEQAGVAALSGTSFGQFGEGYLRFSVANSLENLQQALDRIDQWTKKPLNWLTKILDAGVLKGRGLKPRAGGFGESKENHPTLNEPRNRNPAAHMLQVTASPKPARAFSRGRGPSSGLKNRTITGSPLSSPTVLLTPWSSGVCGRMDDSCSALAASRARLAIWRQQELCRVRGTCAGGGYCRRRGGNRRHLGAAQVPSAV
jgi:hypothetical protein